MKRSLVSLTALFASLAASAALAGTPVELKGHLADSDGRVTLGDLFENAGRASGVVVAQGPAAGGNVILDAGRVQAIARANGLDWTNANGFRRLVVKGEAAGGGPTATQSGRTVQALTWARNVAAGEIVQPADLVWADVQSHLVAQDAPADIDAVVGQAAKRPLRAGAAVARRDLSAPQVIKRGELVTVTFAMDGVSLALQGQAMGAAAVGDPVSILNPQSKKTIAAVATGPGQAVVGPEAEGLRATRFAPVR